MVVSYAVIMAVGVVQSFEDVDTHRVRVALTHAVGVWTLMTLGSAALIDSDVSSFVRMIVGATVLWVLLRVLARVSRGGVGRGDLRLAPFIGAALGFLSFDAAITGIVGMSLVSATWGLVELVRQGRSAHIPFVPSMYAGLLLALVTHG